MPYTLKTDHLTIAVDLDGTFLAASLENRDPLYELIHRNRDKITLIFCSGRALESILPLLAHPALPKPDYIVGDVGATVTDGKTFDAIMEIQAGIDDRWPGTQKIISALKPLKALKRQSVPQERRCSYFIEGDNFDFAKAEKQVRALGCDALYSDNRYFDVLPRDVTKGTSLGKLLALKGLNKNPVLVAGDTMNDYSMFASGFFGVAVGGSEELLVQRLTKLKNAFVSEQPGTRGILDGLLHFDFVEKTPSHKARPLIPFGTSEFVMVYHRQPFDEFKSGKKIQRKVPQSPNGIIPSLLGFLANGKPASWVAWAQHNHPSEPFETHVKVDAEKYPELTAARIPLAADDINLFYKKFSKEAFWPIIFSFPEKVQIDHSHWEHYKKINQLFAEQAAREAARGALVWIHDYNLWLVPGMLRHLRPDVEIAFFHHTSFPTPDIFNILPWKKEIIGSLIQCDHVGFHIPRYAENFASVVRSNFKTEILGRTQCAPRFLAYGCALGVDSYVNRLQVEGRQVGIGAHPVGVALERIHEAFDKKKVQESIHKLEAEFQGQQLILSVERLDYVKGPIEKLEAFERLLEKHPELHEKIAMINIVTPPAPGMDIYRPTREKLDQTVGRINGRFAKLSWTPIRYFFKSFPFEDLLAFYTLSDIAWITPLRDGLNLVCKEYVAVKDVAQKPGILVLSEFAGASVELHGALLTNPFDKQDMVDTLHKALNLDPRERLSRQRQLASIVRANEVSHWGKSFLRHVKAA